MEYLHVDDEIHLHQLKLFHAEMIFETIDRDRNYLRAWLPFVDQTRKLSDTKEFIQELNRSGNKQYDYVYTIWYKNNFAGLAGFKDTDAVNKKTEIGYWLAQPMQKKGIATRTVKKLVDFAFRNLNLNRIQIKVAKGNQRSSAIPKKLGFTFEGVEREGEFHSSRYADLEIFSYLRTDWRENLIKNY
jgi:ribosomal-protein-serine acetyltransferase